MKRYERESIFSARKHRANHNYSQRQFVKRLLWIGIRPFLRLLPRFFYETRNRILRILGAEIGQSVRIYPSVKIFYPWNLQIGDEVTIGDDVILYSLGKIIIGNGTMISYRAHLCAGSHDYHKVNLPLTLPEVVLGEGIWVCTEAFIGPGVTVGDFSIIGARSVVIKTFPERSIIAGNPAVRIKERPLPEGAIAIENE